MITVEDGSLFSTDDEVSYVTDCADNQNEINTTIVVSVSVNNVTVLNAVDVTACVTNAWNPNGSILFNLTTGKITDANSHAEGSYCIAGEGLSTGEYNTSHVEGRKCVALLGGHAEGGITLASGSLSHSEGYFTIASGYYSHAEGYECVASGMNSHAGGRNNTAAGIGTAVIGANGISGTSDYTTYVEHFNVKSSHTNGTTPISTATYTVLASDFRFHVLTGTTITIPTSGITEGREFIFKDGIGSATTQTITVESQGSELFDGESNMVISEDWDSVRLYVYDGNLFKY